MTGNALLSNSAQFSGPPGAKFTNREAAEKIAADWNATYGDN